jgi:hypothetical protein
MSNTAEVTPHVDDQSPAEAEAAETLASAVAGVIAVGGIAAFAAIGAGARLAASVLAETDEERAARERHAAARSAALLQRGTPCEMRLRRPDPRSLIAAAKRLGYRSVGFKTRVNEPMTLARSDGDLLVLSRSRGHLGVTSNAGQEAIHEVVRQATLDDVTRHLQSATGKQVRVRETRDGRIELRAAEAESKQEDGSAQITVQIDRRGVAHVDIEGVRGNRCEKVLQRVAEAIGGQVKNKRIKPDYYVDAAAEPARVRTGR